VLSGDRLQPEKTGWKPAITGEAQPYIGATLRRIPIAAATVDESGAS